MSQVEVDSINNTITLIRGPGFPSDDISNGFDWKFDNSRYIQNFDCDSWEFYDIDGGKMLNCYPEKLLQNNGYELLKFIKNL